jgi:O-antigen ligase
VFGLISLSRSYVEGSSLYFIASIVIPLFSFLVIGNSRKDKPALDIWMRAISIVAIMVAIYGIYIALANPGKRIGSTWSNAMTINGFYALAFFFCLALFFKTPFLVKRIFWLFAACIIFLGMLFTYTRMAMLAIVFGMLLMMYKNRRIRLWGIFAIALIPLIIPSAMLDRGETNSLIDISIFIRLIAWYNATSVILENPVFGIGFSTWKEIYHDMVPLPVLYAQHAHNVYINLLLEIGFFGTLAYLNIIFKSLRRYYIEAVKPGGDMVSYSIWVGMLSLLFSCLTDIFIQQYTVSLLFWITLALMVKEGKMNGELAGETEILQK